MKLKAELSKFLTNKWVLNIVAILAFLNVIGYIVLGNLNSAIFFIIVAVLVRYFSKNMIIVLGIPLILVNLLSLKGDFTEGLENNTTSTTQNIPNTPICNVAKCMSSVDIEIYIDSAEGIPVAGTVQIEDEIIE